MRRYLGPLLALGLALVAGCGAKNPVVIVDTSMGPIKIELFETEAPITVKNFLRYVNEKHYDNTIFHRVIKDFMIQGGGFTAELKEKSSTDLAIKNESYNGISNKRGTVAMARTQQPDTATDQFFINVVDNVDLDRKRGVIGAEGYCVFGTVIEGMDVADRISKVATGNQGVPVEPVFIRSIRLVDAK